MSEKTDNFLLANGKNFRPEDMPQIKQILDGLDDSKQSALAMVTTKDPIIMLVIAIFLGGWGVDRFMMGQVGLGILKIVTFGGLGIWWLIDCITALGRTRDLNKKNLMMAIG